MFDSTRLILIVVVAVTYVMSDTSGVAHDLGLDLSDEYHERPDRGVHHHLPYSSHPNQYPGYHPPAPPPPRYNHHPSHNCSVEDELLTAEICTPTYTTSCGPVSVRGTKLAEREECVDITRTVCTTEDTRQEVEICLVEYQPAVKQAEAITVEVKFSKVCDKQMVTVCQPQPAYSAGTYHTVQHCKEVGQETCYNVPRLEPSKVKVDITLPEPVEKCQTRQVIVPTVRCQDVTEKSCVKLPNAEEASVEVVACVPVVDKPKCDKVELVLPKQICRELLYGHAEKPIQKPTYHHHSKITYVPTVPKKRETEPSQSAELEESHSERPYQYTENLH